MPSDTFHVIPVGLLPLPGICSICGSNQRDCLDWGITVEYHGAVLVCVECCQDLANVDELGLMHRSDAGDLLSENLRLTAKDMEMESVRRDLRGALLAVADNVDNRVSQSLPAFVPATEVPEKESRNLF